MPASVHLTPEQMNELFPPTPPPVASSREAQLEAALDAVLRPLLERIVDMAELAELCSTNQLAAERLIVFAIRDLTWKLDQLRPKGAA